MKRHRVPPPDYDAIERRAWKESQKAVSDEVKKREPRLLKRVNTLIDRFQYSKDVVLQKIIHDEIFATNFAKEPRRTGFYEAIAASWISNLPHVSSFKVLPKSGSSSIKVTSDGNLEHAIGSRSLPGKSLDFYWKTGKFDCYAMHKYTKAGGGNQDSQYKEMVELLRRFLLCNNDGIVLFIIVDGRYYQEHNKKRLNALKRIEKHGEPQSIVLSIDELQYQLPILYNKD